MFGTRLFGSEMEVIMTRRIISHAGCDHGNTREERHMCRDAQRHADCTHPQTLYYARLCMEMRAHHAECAHDMSRDQLINCPRYRGGREKE
ncbi:hypothetical protein NI25_25470 [Streptomyces sp. CCM_MD2014]|nr:hypothetical protein NI25_25470 [Streptomyces sp. CCM_MD2014]